MKGRKGSVDEGGLRVPFLIQWPKHLPSGKTVRQIAGAIDLLPTLADLAGVPLISKKPLDGRSLKPLLLGKDTVWPERMIFSAQGKRVSVRTHQYRLDSEGRLYDLVSDPGQTRDIAADQARMAAKLGKAAADWRREVGLNESPDIRPFPVGHSRVTWLPARDGVAAGGIKRSSIHPNASFFTNWTSSEDRMTWDIDVLRAGAYEATLFYTCPANATGSVVELSFGRAQLHAKITEAHDPPLLGRAEDRVPRTESYVKVFRPMSMGRMNLPVERGRLTLRAIEIPDAQVADVRYLRLTRIG
jgi:hypothetical protein